MTAMIITVLLILFFLTALFLTWFFIHRARTKERLLLIEKGIDLSNLPKSGNFRINFPWLKIGIIIISISIGLIIGAFLMSSTLFHRIAGGQFPLLLMFLFGGIGMVLAYFIDKPQEKK